jgi:hypothetical protein
MKITLKRNANETGKHIVMIDVIKNDSVWTTAHVDLFYDKKNPEIWNRLTAGESVEVSLSLR